MSVAKVLGLAGVVSAASLTSAVHAASVLPTDFSLADASADITTVGVAIIGLAAVTLSLRWIKATFF